MSDVTRILDDIQAGDSHAAEQLLPVVYDELRKLATARLGNEPAGQTLEATALVHEAFLRLVEGGHHQKWNSRGHFFGAAAEAMRRILVENARRKQRIKHGGEHERQELDEAEIAAPEIKHDLMALDDALTALESDDPAKAELVKLRFFAGLTIQQAAEALGISTSTADRQWAYARAWLFRRLGENHSG